MSVKFGLGEDADIIDEKDGKIDSDNDDMASDLRRWTPKILTGLIPDDRAKEERALEEDIGKLMYWQSKMQEWDASTDRAAALAELQRLRHKSSRLIECLRFSRCLAGGSESMVDSIKRGLSLALPPDIGKAFIQSFDNDRGRLPSASLVRHAEFCLDIALLLWQRERSLLDVVRYLWSDSSPMGGFDWLWSQHHEIERCKLVETAQAVWSFETAFRQHVLKLIKEKEDEEDEGDIDHLALQRKDEWIPWLESILRNIIEHINPPAALGQGFRDVQDKLKAIVFKWALQTQASHPLDKVARTIVGHTSDMGVEAAIADFRCRDIESLLPPWMDRGSLELDIEGEALATDAPCVFERDTQVLASDHGGDGPTLDDDDSESAGGVASDVDGPELDSPVEPAQSDAPFAGDVQDTDSDIGSEFALPEAIPIAGLQHVIDNLTKDAHQSMHGWDTFFTQLKQFESLLRSGDHRRTYVWTCLRGHPLKTQEHRFSRWSSSLYEARWREVCAFLRHLVPLLPTLCATWDPQKFKSGRSGDAGIEQPCQEQARERQEEVEGMRKFDPGSITKSLRSSFFLNYCSMVLFLDDVPTKMAEWSEGCRCHGCLHKILSPYLLKRLLANHFNSIIGRCPMGGKRASEIVSGKFMEVIEELWKITEGALHSLPTLPGASPMTHAQHEALLADFYKAQVTMMTLLRIKLEYWRKLPWILAGLSDTDEEKARACGRLAVLQWRKDPRRDAHHRITWKLMRPNSVFLAQLIAFVDGRARNACGTVFLEQIAVFMFLPTVETTIEEKHARVSLSRRRHYIGPVRVSLSNRFPLFERHLNQGVINIDAFCIFFFASKSFEKSSRSFERRISHPSLWQCKG